MGKIVKALPEEKEAVIEVINAAFKDIRPAGFDIASLQKEAYQGKGRIPEHFLLKENGKIVGVAGNLIDEITVGGAAYRISRVGSVAVLPEYRGRGHMRALMQAIEEENLAQGVVFSVLTGKRERYNRFGYEIGPYSLRFTLDPSCLWSNPSLKKRTLSRIGDAYALYHAADPLHLRGKKQFLSRIKTELLTPYAIEWNGGFVGYAILDKAKQEIVELRLKSSRFAEKALSLFPNCTVLVPSLEKELIDVLTPISEKIERSHRLMIKVYDQKRFLSFLASFQDVPGIFEADSLRFVHALFPIKGEGMMRFDLSEVDLF